MIKLSDRLQIIADKIKNGETMADIGTDHGFLPIYLKLSGKSPKVIMADVSVPSLGKAEANGKLYEVGDENVHYRAGDGLAVLGSGEVDAVVIAGMGGKLIRNIMAKDMDLTRSIGKFIMQPRIGQGHLRKWLVENGFRIIAEDVVIEGDYIPEVITAVTPGYEAEAEDLAVSISNDYDGDDIIWKIPPWIVKAGGPVGSFIDRQISLQEEKLENVRKARTRNFDLEDSICSDIEYLQKLRKEWENGI